MLTAFERRQILWYFLYLCWDRPKIAKENLQLIVSVEPLPKQGCEPFSCRPISTPCLVSVEPLPKQGCEVAVRQAEFRQVIASQWNSCRSRGARRPTTVARKIFPRVSVEPLPKQGCEQIGLSDLVCV